MVTTSRLPKYWMDCPGLRSDSVMNVVLDEKYQLVQPHPTYSLAIVPLPGISHPSLEEVVFYANCIAFDHDMPIAVVQKRGRSPRRPLHGGRAPYDSYVQDLAMVGEALWSMKLGALSVIEFRWDGLLQPVNLQYSSKYAPAAQELSLYHTALWQVDPLSEFLCYYRVIESLTTNHKKWIASRIASISTYDFGSVRLIYDGPGGRRARNALAQLKQRARSRVRILQSRLMGTSLADYFYNENRCGIAHGRHGVKVMDFGLTLHEVAEDCNVVKLLARMAAEERANALPTVSGPPAALAERYWLNVLPPPKSMTGRQKVPRRDGKKTAPSGRQRS